MTAHRRPPHLLPGAAARTGTPLVGDTRFEAWQQELASSDGRYRVFTADKLAALFLVLGLIFTQLALITTPAQAAPDEITGTVFEDLAGNGLNDGTVGDANNPGLAGVPVSLFRDEAAVQTADSAGDVGQYASIAIGSDGNPVVAYGDVGTGDLEVLHCDDPSCSTYTTTTVESAGSVGQSVSLAIGADGLPVISHYDFGNLDLRVYKCSNVACTAGSGTAVDTVGSQGSGSSITIGTDGLPIISYFDGTAYDLKVAHCDDAACGSATITAIDTASTTGVASSIAIGSDGLAVVSYRYVPGADLKVAHCDNVACTSGTSTTVDSAGDLAGSSSIARGSDGFPAVAYFDLSNRDLKFARCTNLACTSSNITTVETDDAGFNPSIAIGLDGNPIIAHYNSGETALQLNYCDNLDCSSSSSSTPDSAGNVGSDPSIALGAGGAPVVAYFDQGNYDLKIASAANGAPDAGDTFVSTATTDVNGAYSFSGLSAGEYLVAVESTAVAATAGYDTAQTDSWAEQTYGPVGSLCADGLGGKLTRSTAGVCYGGSDATTSDSFDSASPDVTAAEHVASITAGAAPANFGFSFNAVTMSLGGDTRDDAAGNRTVQGSLRQFIQNANAITGGNAMRFVPAHPTNDAGGGGAWWRLWVTTALPTIVGDGTTIDGTAFDFTDGTTVRNTNAAQIGAGVAVGTDGNYTTPRLDPELEIQDHRPTAVLPTGLVFEADDSVLRHVSIWGFGDSASTFDANVRFGTNFSSDPDFTGSLAEFNVIGTGPASFNDPGATDRSGQMNLTMRETDNAIVRDNLIGFAGGIGIGTSTGSNSLTVQRNEIRRNGILDPIANPVSVWISGSVTGNLITDNASGVHSGSTLWITYEDNTITANGWGGTRPHGIQVSGSPTTIRRNIIADNAGSGVVPGAIDTDVYITRNSMYGNGTVTGSIGIDLLASGDDSQAAPFVTLNDAGDGDNGSNGLLNYPVLDTANIDGTDLVVTGWANPGTTIEFYLADSDPSGFGEGQTWLISKIEGSADDTDATTGTYGPGPVNGIAQGTDTTNRFAFTIPTASLAAPVTVSDQLTALATSGTNTSEFGGRATVRGPFVVNSTGDADDANPGDGVCETATAGECTLRAAIEEANAFPGTDTINFNIPTGDTGYTAAPVSFTIQPQSLLPAISTPMVLDASTQPEYATANRPVIEVDGADVSAGEENGFYLTGGDATVRGFVLNNWGDDAIDIEFNDGNTIVGNYIGTNVTGTAAKANAWGINLKTANNIIGGTAAANRNVVSGNLYDGFYIYNATATGNLIQGNYIGTNAAGTAGLANGNNGLYVWNGAHDNTIGGATVDHGNVISGNGTHGVEIKGVGTDSNDVMGNFIGTDAAGTADLGNGGEGINMTSGAQGNAIGGTAAGERNIISGNSSDGIFIAGGGTDGNSVVGNYIGVDVTGAADLGNGGDGVSILIDASDNTVGGTVAGARNVISGNNTNGIGISGSGTTLNKVLGNYIGTTAAGDAAVPNNYGVRIFSGASGNSVGGTVAGSGNLISGNTVRGVMVDGSTSLNNAILGNSIVDNAGLGIELGIDGVTANDLGDGDTGANDLLNFPVITSATETAGTVTANFDLDVPNGDYRVEFLANTAADPSGNGEGETFLSSINVSVTGGVPTPASHTFAGSAGDILTATATEGTGVPFGSTSEFSAAFTVLPGAFIVNSTGDAGDNNPGNGVCYTGSNNTQSQPACTLRAAIEEANAFPGDDTVEFDLPAGEPGHSGGVWTIAPAGVLPSVGSAVTIDGTTQPGYVANTNAMPAGLNGSQTVAIDGSVGGTSDGLRITGDDVVVKGLVIGGFPGRGILISGDDAVISGVYVGTTVSGSTANPNTGNGISVTGARVTIGGAMVEDRFLISGNGSQGIQISGVDAEVSNGVIGLNAGATLPRPNGANGIAVTGTTGATIGAPGMGNVISGNNLVPATADGIYASGGGSHTIQANLIGTNSAGDALGNYNAGIALSDTAGVTIGGTGAGEGNVVSGNGSFGIAISGAAATLNTIVGNHIGTDPAGTSDLGNGTDGVAIRNGATSNTVGGTTPAHRNYIAGNDNDGVWITGLGTDLNKVQGNWIGYGSDGSPLGNDYHGVAVEFDAADNLIGGDTAAAANRIGNSGWDGISFNGGDGTGNAALRNEIVGNTGLGIDIDNDDVTPNDLFDVDTGDNDLLNYPVIAAASESGGTVTVDFHLDVPDGTYRVEFFDNTAADPSGNGEGESFIDSIDVSVTTGIATPASHSFVGSAGDIITATATEGVSAPFGSSSEFSAAVTVTAPNNPPTAVTGGPYTIAEGEDLILDGSGSSDPDTDPLTYLWDVDNDGSYDDAVGPNPTVAWATLVGLGIDDDGGPLTIRLQVDDSVSGSDSNTGQLTITNTAPDIVVTGTGVATAATPYIVTVSVIEPGDDTVTDWTVSWGDGTHTSTTGPLGAVAHIYSAAGHYDVTVSVVDEDGYWSDADMFAPSWETARHLGRYDGSTGAFEAELAAATTVDRLGEVEVGPDGLVYVSSYMNSRIARFDPSDNSFVDYFVTTGLTGPLGLEFGPDGNLYVSDWDNSRVRRYNGTTGADMGTFASGSQLNRPSGLTFGPDGNLYVVSNFGTNTVIRYDGSTGAFIDVFTNVGGTSEPEDIEFGPDGNLYVAYSLAHQVGRFDGSTGAFIDSFVPAGSGLLDEASGIEWGPDGNLYVSSRNTHEVKKYDGGDGTYLGNFVAASSGGLTGPLYATFLPDHQVRCDPAPDTTPPVITLNGANPQIIEVGDAYVELGATALDDMDGDISGSIVIDASGVNTSVVGSYSVTYDVSDSSGNAATQFTRTVEVVDTTAPVLTLLGANPQVIEVGDAYVELGATAIDVGDGDLTGSIVIDASAVNASVVGVYVVTYDVVDSSGNPASGFRTINVVDTTAPVIMLLGANPQTIEAGSGYTELGATAFDVGDGDVSGSIVIDASGVNTLVVGSYSVTYDVTDSQGNAAATVTRTVDVIDTGVPVITLLGANPQTIEVGDAYLELGATAFDVGDGDISASIVIDASGVDTSVVGSYSVTYDVTDSQGNPAATVSRTVDVVDTTAPVITLLGANPQTIEAGAAYAELGAIALDAGDGDVSGAIVIDASAVDTSVLGSYPVTYDVTDSQGNAAATVTRTVDVVDTGVPVITLLGANPQTIEVGDAYTELWATALDNYDGDISASIVIDASGVDTNVVGSYSVTYDVTDGQGNAAATVTRTVDVVDTTAPVIILLGANPQTVEAGAAYAELGATAFDSYDGDISASIVIDASAVNTSAVGSYAVTYDVTDSSGNPATAFRVVDVVDTTAPVITLLGANPQIIEVGSVYAELGATAVDVGDGDISASIVVDASGVDTLTVGSYLVTYDVTDSQGNAGAQVTRMVDVVDTTAPVITLLGANPQVIEIGSAYAELGATALDNYDGDISASIVIDASGVDTLTVGSYSVTYDVTDSHGNAAATVTRTVDVVDTTTPVITLLGANPQVIEAGAGYTELGATAFDIQDGDISGWIVIDASAVDTNAVGSYVVTYDVTDSSGNPATAFRTVDVVDTTAPVITLLGANPQVIEVGSAYTELGATAFDSHDGDISASIVIDASAVNTSVVAGYTVTYNVTDANGNPAATVTRTVDVVDTTAPVITLLGSNPQIIEAGSAYTELWATAFDNYDGDISGSIVIDASGVDTFTVGTYTVTYDVSDAHGNPAATVTRTVDVVDTTAPVITLLGSNPQIVEVGSPYTESGATAIDSYDGDVSASILIDASGVNTSVVGSYAVTYNVSDSHGNPATQVIRTVDVVDTSAPIITLLGANPQTIEVGSAYTELGATAFDSYDGDVSASIVIDASGVNMSAVGSYFVTYDVVDSEGNSAVQAVRTVDVVDTTAPVITLLGANPQVINVTDPYVELGATATDNNDGDITASIIIDSSAVNTAVPGTYNVTYNVTDSQGNAAVTVTRTVDVLNVAPTLGFIADQSIDEGTSVLFTASATDPDVTDPLTFSLAGAPSGASIDPLAGAFSWVPGEPQGPGVYSFDVVVTDGGAPSLTDSQTITITVAEVNEPPTLSAIANQSVTEQTAVGFVASATDPDLPANNLTFSLAGAPAGAVIDPATGVFSWTPTEAQGPGTYTFDVVVGDDGSPSLSDTQTITIGVGENNLAPLVNSPGAQTSAEGDTITLPVVASDVDLPANVLTHSATGLPAGLAINSVTGQISGTLPYSASGGSPYTVTVTVTDNGSPSRSGSATFSWTVADTNRVPVAAVDVASATEDAARTINVLANDSDPDGDPLTILGMSQPANGTAAISGNRIIYTPNPDYFGPDSFVYTATDGRGGVGVAAVDVTVAPVNDAPTLSALTSLQVAEGTQVVFLATSSDVEGDAVTYTLSGAPAGAAIEGATGRFTWTPGEAQGPGTYVFTVVGRDSGAPPAFASKQVEIAVTEVNRTPALADPGGQFSAENDTVSLRLIASDPDLPTQTLTYSASGLPPGLSIDSATGEITGTLPFDAADGSPYTVTATVVDSGTPERGAGMSFQWHVAGTNRSPIANDIVVYAQAGVPVSLVLDGSDPDGDPLAFEIVAQPTQGGLVGGPRLYDYTARAGATGTDVITFAVSDGDLEAIGTVTIAITPNYPPLGTQDVYSVRRGGAIVVDAPGVLGNDGDPEGHPITASIDTQPSHGVVTLEPDGSFVYSHRGDDVDLDTFTYRISDGLRVSEPVVVRMIIDTNVAPVAVDDLLETGEDMSVLFRPLANDHDPNDELLHLVDVEAPINGSVEWSIDGALIYKPNPNWHGTETITYQISDGELTATAAITIAVRAINDPPVARPIVRTGLSGEILTIDLRAAASDIDGDALEFLLEQPPQGTLRVVGPGVYEIDLAGIIGDLPALTFVVSDPSGAKGTSFVTVTVTIPPELVGIPSLVSDDVEQNYLAAGQTLPNEDAGGPVVTGLRLMVGSVLDTFRAFRMPFALLLLVLLGSLYLGLSKRFVLSNAPVLLPMGARKKVDIVMAPSSAGVPARSEPGSHENVVHRFGSHEIGIVASGARSMLGGDIWVEVETPDGDAWVNAESVTEQQSRNEFIRSDQPKELIALFADAISESGDMGTATASHDLHVAYYGPPVRFAAGSLRRLLHKASVYWWWGPDGDAPKTQGTFAEIVGEPFAGACHSGNGRLLEPQLPIPVEFVNMHSLVVGDDQSGSRWRVFFRFENDEPSIAGLMREAHANPAAMLGRQQLDAI